jgi:branched-chain amino acid transport system ATP-binding protein
MLTLARATLKKPKIIMLDEPSLGLSPKITAELFSILKTLNEKK